MAAAVASGVTCIENCAQDDEVYELIKLLRTAGVEIEISEDSIQVQGMGGLLTAPEQPFRVCADRMEAGTFLAACGITLGDIFLKYDSCPGLDPVLEHLEEMGMSLSFCDGGLKASVQKPLKARSFTTAPHPGFPTDLQAPFLALNCVSEGESFVEETIWENRFLHAHEFRKMGAQIEITPHHVKINGTPMLHGAELSAHDLRGSAASVLLSLRAQGPSLILQAEQHYERGYSFFLEKLCRLGAKVQQTAAMSLEAEIKAFA